MPGSLKISASHAELGIFSGYKGTGLVRIWKYRTKSVHIEYHVGFCETEFPGLELSARHLNPLLNFVEWEGGRENTQGSANQPANENAPTMIELPGRGSDHGGDADGEYYDGVIQLSEDDEG